MNVEATRLETFSNWPSDAEVNPPRIAKAGFFSTKQGLEVECFACHAKISEWSYGDQVMNRHIALNPACPFVVNPATSGNVPILPGRPAATLMSSFQALRASYEMRLATFDNWPVSNIVTPESLARAGFFYTKHGDNTICPFCRGEVRAWEPGDNPDMEHKRHFPRCTFVVEVITPRISSGRDKTNFPNVNLVNNEQNLGELGVQEHRGPKRANYSTVESRLRTFFTWSPDLVQTPDILSQAGFFYEGLGDQVRCFHCDGGLRHWDPQDDPWVEHARWFPTCAFVKLVKGQDFVTGCSMEQSSENGVRQAKERNRNARPKREVSEREVDEQLLSPEALSALGIGLSVATVKRAIRDKLERTGRPYLEVDALIEAALNVQRDQDDSSSEDTSFGEIREAVSTALNEIVTNSTSQQPTSTAAQRQPVVSDEAPDAFKKDVSLEEENRQLKEARQCKICMDAEVGIVFLPCGHLVTCVNCAPNLEDCPVCRSTIKASVRTFLS